MRIRVRDLPKIYHFPQNNRKTRGSDNGEQRAEGKEREGRGEYPSHTQEQISKEKIYSCSLSSDLFSSYCSLVTTNPVARM